MTDQTITIYHNPGCSKSRQALTILEQAGATPEVIQYLTHPPTADQLGTLARQLGLAPSEFIRTGEPAYKTLHPPGPESSSVELLDAMAKHPILIQRPIVVRGNRAILGRPPENVHQLL